MLSTAADLTVAQYQAPAWRASMTYNVPGSIPASSKPAPAGGEHEKARQPSDRADDCPRGARWRHRNAGSAARDHRRDGHRRQPDFLAPRRLEGIASKDASPQH